MELCGLELADSVLQRTLNRDTLCAGSAEEADRLGVVIQLSRLLHIPRAVFPMIMAELLRGHIIISSKLL